MTLGRGGLSWPQRGRHRRHGSTSGRAVWNLVDQGLSSLSNAAVTVLVARTVPAEVFGRFALAFTTSLLLLALVREMVHQPFLLGASALRGEAFREQARSAGGAAVLAGGMLGGGVLVAAAIVRGPVGESLLVAGLTLPLLFWQDLLRFEAQSAARPREAAINDGVWLLGLAVGLTGLIAADVKVAWAYLLVWGGTAGLASVVAAVRMRLPPRLPGSLRWAWARRSTSRWLLVETMAAYGSVQVVILLLGGVVGAAAAGAWRGTQTLLGPVNVLGMAALSFLIPEVVRRPTLSARGRVRAAAALSGGLLLANAVWGGLLLALPRTAGVQLLGDTWDGARTYLPAITVWSAAVALSLGPLSVLQAVGDTRAAARVSILLSPLLIVAALVGLAFNGGLGAAVGVAVAQLAVVPVWWRVLLRVVRRRDDTACATAPSLG